MSLGKLLRSPRLQFALIAFVLAAVPGRITAQAAPAQNSIPVAPRIVDPIDESKLVTIKGTVHPLANARNDRGVAPESMQLERMHLVLTRSSSQESSLKQLISDMHTPGTASYHKWLTPDQFGKQFGPSDQDIATVQTWLTQHGFNVIKVNPGKQTIEFSGNVSQLRNAFHTQVHKYEVDGQIHYGNVKDPQIPAALAPVVGGFVSLNDFQVKSHAKYLGKASYNPKTDKATPEWTVGSSSAGFSFVLSPADYAVQYDLNPLYSAGTKGAGQSIAIVNESNINIYLVNQFRSLFGLPVNPPQVIIDGNDPGVDGINNPDGENGAAVEAYLDVEWAGAVAPGATVNLVIGADTALESGLFLAAERAVYSNIAPIISLSFGNCEANLGSTNTFLNNLWEQAAAQGITVLVSTGDNGSAGCDNDNSQYYAIDGQAVSGFASTPYNVAVGGTDFYYSDFTSGLSALETQIGTYWSLTPSNSTPAVSIKGVIPEQPWNDSQYGLTLGTLEQGSSPTTTSIGAGSGGASAIYTTKPAWQAGTGVPADGVRDIPDLSLFASNGANASYYPICAVDDDCQSVSSGSTVQISGVGGTSASTPSFAGIMALVNQLYGRQGQADFVLYPLAAQFPAAFHDVKNGTNTVPCAIGSTDCIAVSNPLTITDPNLGTAVEGEIGTGTTPEYNATAGYDLASGLGTVDANVLVSDWNKVTFATTTVTLTPSKTSFAHGTPITVSGSVTTSTGTPTGDVALMTNSTEPVQQGQGLPTLLNGGSSVFTLSGGSYSGSVSTLPGGTYSIWGQYSGESAGTTLLGASNSTPVQITVTPENSTLNFSVYSGSSLTTPGTSVDYGTQLNLHAQPAPSVGGSPFTLPTGTVTFTDGSTAINTAVVNAEGNAEYNAPFAVGTHSVTASYSGDQSYNKSTSASPIAFTVVKDTPQILFDASLVDSNTGSAVNGPGQPTVLTVQIENTAQYTTGNPVSVAAPTGTVTLSSSLSGFSGTATLSQGVDSSTNAKDAIATFIVPAGTVSGTYSVTTTYNGDGNYAATSTTASIPIETTSGDGGLTATVAATASGSISPSTKVVITGTVTGQSGKAAPTGAVYVYSSGSYPTGVGLVAGGTGQPSTFTIVLNSQTLFQGTNAITIQYLGDTNYNPAAYVLNTAIANPLSDFTLVPQTTIAAAAAPGDAVTVPINIASVNGFAGAVAITTATNAAIGVQVPASVTLTANGSQTFNLVLTSAAALGSGTFNVLLTGTDPTGKYVHTLGLQLVVGGNVAPSPGFDLSASPTSLSLTAGATNGNTSTITVAPLNGFTAAVGLTCAVAGPSGATSPATCSLASSSVAGGAGTDVLTVVTTSTTTAGAYAVTVTGIAGSITQTTVVTATVTAVGSPSFTLSASPATLSLAPGATSSNTSTITVAPVNGFTGAVGLTCSVSGPTGATSPATCGLASASVSGSPWTDVLTVTTTSSTTAGAYAVTVTGISGSITQTAAVTATVTAAGSANFTLSASPSTLSLSPGATSGNTSTITIAPVNGFTAAVGLTCSVSGPTGATDPATCGLASASVSGSPWTDVLTITTTAPTTAQNKPMKLFWPSAGGAALAMVFFFGIPARRRNWMAMLGLLVFFVSIAGLGCGGGGSTTGGGGGGTTAGTYTVTVTGTSGSLSPETATVTVTVN